MNTKINPTTEQLVMLCNGKTIEIDGKKIFLTVVEHEVTDAPPNNKPFITNLGDLNLVSQEGRLLWAALILLTVEYQTDKTPYEVLEQLEIVATNTERKPNTNE